MYEARNNACSLNAERDARGALPACEGLDVLTAPAQRFFDRCMELERAPSDYLH
jgi:hypothetical protein